MEDEKPGVRVRVVYVSSKLDGGLGGRWRQIGEGRDGLWTRERTGRRGGKLLGGEMRKPWFTGSELKKVKSQCSGVLISVIFVEAEVMKTSGAN